MIVGRPAVRAAVLWGLILGIVAAEDLSYSSDWVTIVEDAEQCPNETKYGVRCTWENGQRVRNFKFPAGNFTLSHQVYVPANTIIEGAKNPNDMKKAFSIFFGWR